MDGIPQTIPTDVQTKKFKLPHPKIVIPILIALIILIILAIFIYNRSVPSPTQSALVSYQLRCGAKLDLCNLSQLKAKGRVSLRIDASAALAKYKDLKPDLCFYTNIEPKIENVIPWFLIKINGNSFHGGCINNAYQTYKERSQHIFFIAGKTTNNIPVVKIFLAAPSSNPINLRIQNDSVEIFDLK